MDDSLLTYRKLREQLDLLTESQLDQLVQILPNNPSGDPVRLEPVLGMATIDELCHVDGQVETLTRSAVDFEHHPEQLVLMSDYSPYSKEGDQYYVLEENGLRGNKTGKLFPFGLE